MTARSFAIPDKVRRNAQEQGAAARAWLSGLPQQIAQIEHDWAITVGDMTQNATEAFVAFARLADGGDAVLKIVMPGFDLKRQELRVLSAANGNGYAKLLRADEAQNVMLLERLGRQLHVLNYPHDRKMAVICAALEKAWMPEPAGPPFATGAQKAAELGAIIESLWSPLGKPCSKRTIDTALGFVARRRRAFDPSQSVLAHGDAHEWNTLEASDGSFRLVDPDGAFAERAFDLAIPMREWGEVLPKGDLFALAGARCRLLSELTGVEQQPIWEWSLLQCISNGLLLLKVGLDAPATVEFAMADAMAAHLH
jgi:streptomycin 6-kinase